MATGYYYPTARIDAAIFALRALPALGDILRTTAAPAIGRIITPAIVREAFSPLPAPERFKAEFPFPLTVRPSQIRAVAEDSAHMAPSAAELQPLYHSLWMPVVILAGADDAIVDMQDHPARLRRDIPHSQLWVEPGVGHMLRYASRPGRGRDRQRRRPIQTRCSGRHSPHLSLTGMISTVSCTSSPRP